LINQQKHYWRYRLGLLLGALLMVPVGYGIRFLGAIPDWFKDFFGSVAYEVFWIFLLLVISPRLAPRRAAGWVFIATCGIEFLQLWQPPFLQALRATLPGRLVLGTTFTWSDFPAYMVGCICGWWFACFWVRHSGFRTRSHSGKDHPSKDHPGKH
jgi:hypothetical protein